MKKKNMLLKRGSNPGREIENAMWNSEHHDKMGMLSHLYYIYTQIGNRYGGISNRNDIFYIVGGYFRGACVCVYVYMEILTEKEIPL